MKALETKPTCSPPTAKGKKLKKEWIATLESGRYQQGTCYLRQRNPDTEKLEYCCLGVLLNIHDRTKWETSNLDSPEGISSWEGKDGDLPEEMRSLMGLNSEAVTALVTMNDDMDFSFKDIAQRLKANDFDLTDQE